MEIYWFLGPIILLKRDSLYGWIRHDIDGSSIFFTACWWLWRDRNKLCLANEVISSYILKFIIVNYVNLLVKCFLKHNLLHPTRTVTWNAHKGSNMILNVDCMVTPTSRVLMDWFEMLMVIGFTILREISVIPTSFTVS